MCRCFNVKLDFLKVRQLASQESISPQRQSQLDFLSVDKFPESPIVAEEDEREVDDIDADAEQVGTIIANANDVGRQALRPQPSNDPNDPLVS